MGSSGWIRRGRRRARAPAERTTSCSSSRATAMGTVGFSRPGCNPQLAAQWSQRIHDVLNRALDDVENPAAPMGVALDLLHQVVGAAAGRTGHPPFMEVDAGQAVQASILPGLIVLLADALLTTVSEAAGAEVGVAA